jgi:hypothetical protein
MIMNTFIKSIPSNMKIPYLQESNSTLETWHDMSDHSNHDFPEGEETMSALLFEEEREEAIVQHSSKDEKTLVDGDDDEDEHSFSRLYAHVAPNHHHEEERSSATLPLRHFVRSDDSAPWNKAFGSSHNKKSWPQSLRIMDVALDVARTPLCDYYGYDAAFTDLKSEQSPHRRRSSMKQGLGRRRASSCVGEEIEVGLMGNGTPVTRTSFITFCKEVHVTSVVPVLEMADKIEDLWFQIDEFDSILERSYSLVDRAAEGRGRFCTRGLENLSKDHDAIKDAIDTVLVEQDFQWTLGKRSDKTISQLYSLSSMESKIEARMRAKQDVEAVKNYLKETRKDCRRLSTLTV